jgi:D-tagatose-bisphosphate aldolase class II non-catalytic subunit
MVSSLMQIISANRAGQAASIPSVCSAHPEVLTASLLLAEELDVPLLIEATSNQVNQFGGYTGMTPADFIGFVHQHAQNAGTDRDRLFFGGDHLGPQAWKSEPVESAMARARTLVADYVAAGFSKIHLDCSEGCAGEAVQLDDATVSGRAADLAQCCEAAKPAGNEPVYIVGTEVPPPGGVRSSDDHDGIAPTDPAHAAATMRAHLAAFDALGLGDAAARIVGLVVQPGVEFGPLSLDRMPAERDGAALKSILADFPNLVFEAHSTDYQTPATFPHLAGMGFAIQKVGPALTFAYRQAVYALDLLIDLLDGPGRNVPSLRQVMQDLMQGDDASWNGHYAGDAESILMQLHFSYSDRIRYYWPRARAQTAIATIFERLRDQPLPDPLLAQVFAPETLARAATLRADIPLIRALVLAEIQSALLPYFFAPVAASK